MQDDPNKIVEEFRRTFYDTKLFFDPYAGGKFANYLFDHARMPLAQWAKLWVRRQISPTYGLPRWVREAEDRNLPIPIVERSQDIIIFVAGGDAPIPQHVYFPTWGFPTCRLVIPIQLPRDWDRLLRDR